MKKLPRGKRVNLHRKSILIMKLPSGHRREKTVFGVCEQQRRRPAYTSAQSDQRLCFSLIGKNHI